MWLIEFFEGHLQGVTLPIDPKLVLTGAHKADQADVLCLPEYLDEKAQWEIRAESSKAIITDVRKNKTKALKANRIYRYGGLRFSVYPEGRRAPEIKWYRLKQYGPFIALSLLLNLGLSAGLYKSIQKRQESSFADYLKNLDSGYIKDGKLHVFNQKPVEDPLSAWQTHAWQTHIKWDRKEGFSQVSQLNIALVSDTSGKPLKGSIVAKPDHDEIRVQTFEADNRIMTLLGQRGIAFSKEGEIWYVSNRSKASQILQANGLGKVAEHLQTRQDDSEIIESSEFPYSIFYSSDSGHYLYDQQSRYWEGSRVPRLGVIQTIERDKVTFKQGQRIRVYYIEP